MPLFTKEHFCGAPEIFIAGINRVSRNKSHLLTSKSKKILRGEPSDADGFKDGEDEASLEAREGADDHDDGGGDDEEERDDGDDLCCEGSVRLLQKVPQKLLSSGTPTFTPELRFFLLHVRCFLPHLLLHVLPPYVVFILKRFEI